MTKGCSCHGTSPQAESAKVLVKDAAKACRIASKRYRSQWRNIADEYISGYYHYELADISHSGHAISDHNDKNNSSVPASSSTTPTIAAYNALKGLLAEARGQVLHSGHAIHRRFF